MKRRLETKQSIWVGLMIAVISFTLTTVSVEAKVQIVTPASTAISTASLTLTPDAIASNSPRVIPNPVVEEENPSIKGTEFTISPYEKIWIPASLPNNTMQCVFSHNAYRTAGGVGGQLYFDPNPNRAAHIPWRLLASEFGCAQILHNMPIVKDATQAPAVADKFDTLLEALALISGRPEIVNVPIVQTGLSAKGAVAYWLAKQRSWKTIALVVYHQSLYRDFALSALDLASPFNVAKIPSLYLAGGLDNLVPPTRLHRSIQRLRALNFPVTFAIQPALPHANMGDQEFAIEWVREILQQRLGETGTLNPISSSYMVGTYELGSSGAGIFGGGDYLASPETFPVDQFNGTLGNSIYLPSITVAQYWVNYAKTGKISSWEYPNYWISTDTQLANEVYLPHMKGDKSFPLEHP